MPHSHRHSPRWRLVSLGLSALSLFGVFALVAQGSRPAAATGGAAVGTPIYLPYIAQARPTTTPSACGPAPTLMSPAPYATLNTRVFALTWDAGNNPAATVVVIELSASPTFTPLVNTYPVNYAVPTGSGSYTYTLNLDEGTWYYWRVTLKCGATLGDAATGQFVTGQGGVLPAAVPQLLAPMSGSVITYPTTLLWQAAPTTTLYTVMLTRTTGTPAVARRVTDQTQYDLQKRDLTPGATYAWAVQSQNAYGYGPHSVGSLFVVSPTWPPFIPVTREKAPRE